MTEWLGERLDRFGRRHPRLMLWATVLLGMATALILVYNTKDTTVVYRAF
jgi:hypothetical protein